MQGDVPETHDTASDLANSAVIASAEKSDSVITTIPTDAVPLGNTTSAPPNSTHSGSTIDASFMSPNTTDHEQTRSQLIESLSLASMDGTSEWTEVSARVSDCDVAMAHHDTPSPPHVQEDIGVNEGGEVTAMLSSPLSSPQEPEAQVSPDPTPEGALSTQDSAGSTNEFVRGAFVAEETESQPFGAPPFEMEALGRSESASVAAMLEQLQPVTAEIASLLATVPTAVGSFNKSAIYKQLAWAISLTVSSVMLFSSGLQLMACQHASGVLWPSVIVTGGLVGGLYAGAQDIAILFATKGKPSTWDTTNWVFGAVIPTCIGLVVGGCWSSGLALVCSHLYGGTFLAGVACMAASGFIMRQQILHWKKDVREAKDVMDTVEECIAYFRQTLK
jgi:hypothetical protein